MAWAGRAAALLHLYLLLTWISFPYLLAAEPEQAENSSLAEAAAAAGEDSKMAPSADNHRGLILALSSSLFIGASFIIKKKGLKRAGAAGVRAGVGGYSYLYEPLWWTGMITMIFGEVANFAAYAFAPAILVTPLGALSIIVSAALAHVILKEKLHILGMLGCALCVVGSTTIVLHAPPERDIESVKQVWELATEPAFLLYASFVIALVVVLIFYYVPQYGHTQILVYIGICSLMGSLSVMSAKALGIALKLTFEGLNQLMYPQTWVFAMVLATCVITQMNYLNRALDTFNTAVVSPIYYVMFTSLTILASVIMFKDWDRQTPAQVVTEICGFITILAGTYLLHVTKDHCEPVPGLGPLKNGERCLSFERQFDSMVAAAIYNGFPGAKRPDEEMAEQIPLRRQESLHRSP